MGAETRILVQVVVPHREWREVYAVSRSEAESKAQDDPDVIAVLRAVYPEDFTPADSEHR